MPLLEGRGIWRGRQQEDYGVLPQKPPERAQNYSFRYSRPATSPASQVVAISVRCVKPSKSQVAPQEKHLAHRVDCDVGLLYRAVQGGNGVFRLVLRGNEVIKPHIHKKQQRQPIGLPLCDSARIQTWNRLIRSQVLYSVELRSRIASANIGAFFELCKYFVKNF